jgi:pimeloyl-ACP methyl ester carboxylesterase
VVYDPVGLTFAPTYQWSVFKPTNGSDVQQLLSLMEPESEPLPRFVRRDLLRYLQAEQWVVDRNLRDMLTGRDVLDQKLAGLQEPLLIIWGSTDALVPLAVGERMHTLDPRSELDVVEGCGHLAPHHCSARVAAATADFLKSNPAPSGGVRTLSNVN